MVPWRADWPRYLALSIGVVVSAFGAAVLAAWYAHFLPLIQPSPDLPPLTRQGAMTELLLGAALVFLAIGRKRAAAFCAAIALVLALFVIFEYGLDRDLGFDQLLGSDYINDGSRTAGRISPVAALSYLGGGLALLAMSSRKLARYGSAIAGIVASILIAFGLVTFLSYSLGHTLIYAWGHFRHISIQAGAVVFLLGSGIMAMALRESRGRLPAWLPLGIGLGLTVGALGMWQALIQHKQGQMLLLSHIVLAGGIVGALLVAIAVHVTLKATQRNRELQQGKAAFERLFEASPDALLVTNRDGRIVGANQQVERVFGYTRDEVIGASIESLVPTQLHDLRRAQRERYYVHPSLQPMGAGLELLGRRKDASEFPVEVALSPLQSAGEAQVLAAVRDITERKQAQEALRESEERFRGVFETSPLGLALIEQDYRLAKVNPSLCRMSGYSEAELLAINPLDLTHPDDREESARLAERLFQGEIPFYQLEKRYVKKSGEIIWASMTATILRDHEGRPIFGLGMLEDITDRRQEQEALRESEERFRGLFEQGPIGITLMGKDYRMIKVNAALSRMLGYSEAELTTMTALDFTHPDDRGPTVNMTERLFETEGPFSKIEKRYLKKSGEIIWGSVTASVIHDQQGRPLYGMGMIEDITERKQAQEELRQSEERFREIFEQGPLGIILMSKDYRLTRPNAAFCRMLGYSAEELTRMTMLDLTHPDDRKASVDLVDKVFSTGAPHLRLEKRYVKKSGEIMWGNVTTAAIHDDQGRPLYSIGMIEDITERKHAEEALRTLSQRLSQAIRFASMSVWEWDPLTNCFVWDDKAFEMAGIPKVVPLPYEQWARLVHPDDRDKVEAAVQRVFREKAHEYMEFRIIRPDGEVRYTYAAGGPVLDQQGNVIRVVGVAADITERKRAEDELRTLTQRLSLAAKSSSMGVWDWNLHTDQAIWDDTMFEIFDIPKKATVAREDWARRIHAVDLAKVEAFLKTVIRGKTQDSVEFRIIRRDGSVRYVSVTGGAVLDDRGNATGVVGIAVDVTERKRTEEELHTLSERLSLATQIASIGVWDWDLRTNLEVWDDASFEMFDMPKVNPVRHEDFVRHIHPDDRARVREATERVIQEKAQESVEFRIVRLDGSVRHLSVAAGSVLDEQGHVARMVGIAIDVTGRKQMEAKLEASRDQMIASARLSALGMMAGGIAHEINNPLSIIHAVASDLKEMVDETGTAPPHLVSRKSTIIRDTADRIAKIVKSLRQISREGAADPPHPTRLAKILEETLEICRARFTANGVRLILPQSIPELTVPCREVQIAQALLNLLQNAFDAVVEKEGDRWVKIEVGTYADSVAISVIDNGPGIPPELRSRIMEPFFTTKEVGKGTGLGLSLSKTIAEEHGGKLEYGQNNGHTRFSLVLPLAQQAEAA
ncbi:MAG TPA: PAS domain S-box protein [Candidatus Angelobacter sp.]